MAHSDLAKSSLRVLYAPITIVPLLRTRFLKGCREHVGHEPQVRLYTYTHTTTTPTTHTHSYPSTKGAGGSSLNGLI